MTNLTIELTTGIMASARDNYILTKTVGRLLPVATELRTTGTGGYVYTLAGSSTVLGADGDHGPRVELHLRYAASWPNREAGREAVDELVRDGWELRP